MSDSVQGALDALARAQDAVRSMITDLDEPSSKRAERDHAIAAEVWNRLGLDNAREIGRWLNGAIQEIHWHRSRMTPEQLKELENDAQLSGTFVLDNPQDGKL